MKKKWGVRPAILDRFWASELAVMPTLAVVVGLGAGLGTIAFIWLIHFFKALFFGEGAQVAPALGAAYVIFLPAIGGLLVGPIVHYIAPEAKGHGVPEVMLAVATRGGRIRPIVVLAKTVCSAITIGSGGSVGREGPIVQIGAAIGSNVGQFLKVNERRLITLVAAGAAAGIAATFNAPIAGVMFAIEVILAELAIRAFGTVVVAAVTASVISRAVLGDSPAFSVPSHAMTHAWELALYLGLGVTAAFGALLYMKSIYLFDDLFATLRINGSLKPAVGGVLVGVLGYFLPQIFGTGFETITLTLTGVMSLVLLLLLVPAKILATSLSIGSGASGGVFAPALFVGAVLGGAYGKIAEAVFPSLGSVSGAYAMVGMAAVFAGAARAPMTAIMILFEMTQDYHMILPLMFATVVSTLLAHRFEPESIYTLKLKRRGIDVRARRDENLMRAILVEEAMTPATELVTMDPATPITHLAFWFQETGQHGFVVLDENKELLGVVALSDLDRALTEGILERTVGDICSTNLLVAYPDETLEDAMHHFGARDVGRMPVVDRRDPKRLLGLLGRSDIIRAYSQVLVDAKKRDQRIAKLKLEAATGAELIEVDIAEQDAAAGRTLRELPLPPDCVVVSIHRGRRVVVPRGNTSLLRGDRVLALVAPKDADAFRRTLQTGSPLLSR